MIITISGGSPAIRRLAFEAVDMFDTKPYPGVNVSLVLKDCHIIQAGDRRGFGVFDWPKNRGSKNLTVQVAALPLPEIEFNDWAYGFRLNVLHELMHVKQYLTGRRPNESWATRWAKRAMNGGGK